MRSGKTCGKCGVEKGLDEYHRRRKAKDGRSPWCKACCADYNRQRIAADRGAQCLFKGYPGPGGPFPGAICSSINVVKA